MTDTTTDSHVFDVTVADFEADVLQKSVEVPVLVDFWATWCGPCKTLGPILEKLAADFNGAFLLAKVDVDQEKELAQAFQIRSIPTVILVKGGQPVDGFPGALPEGQLRQFLEHHGIVPAEKPAVVEAVAEEAAPLDRNAEVTRLRAAVAAASEQDAPKLNLDLALALLHTDAAPEAEQILDALPANLATDDRAIRARAHLGFAALLKDAPPAAALETAIASNPDDLHARHLLAAQRLIAGDTAAGLDQLIEMLRRNRAFEEGLPKRSLIDAFRMIEDADVVGIYRRKMATLLF